MVYKDPPLIINTQYAKMSIHRNLYIMQNEGLVQISNWTKTS
jgi:hypothetical protein